MIVHTDTPLRIPCGREDLDATLFLPPRPTGVIVFAHGSGSSRLSPCNTRLGDMLCGAGFATVLADLLTPREATDDSTTCRFRFDIDLLTARLDHVVDTILTHPVLAPLPLGCLGAGTGAAAVLRSAVERPHQVAGVVCRGGRPDLVQDALLRRVKAPTLLIVGALDPEGIEANREALALLRCRKRLVVIPGVGHVFEEGDVLLRTGRLAAEWFSDCLEEPSS